MRSGLRLENAAVGFIALVGLVQVLFSDLLGGGLANYEAQRFFLVFVIGAFSAGFLLVLLSFSHSSYLRTAYILGPVSVMSLGFLIASYPFRMQQHSWVEPGMYALFFFGACITGAALSARGQVKSYCVLYISGLSMLCAFYGLASINIYLFATFDGVSDLVDYIPWGFVNIRYWSHVATWCLPIVPLSLLIGPLRQSALWKAFVILGCGFWWWILIISAARGSILGIVFSMFLVFLLFGRSSIPWLKAMFAIFLSGGVIWVVLSLLIPFVFFDGAGNLNLDEMKLKSSGRITLFSEAWKMSMENFPFGMGPQAWIAHDPITSAYENGPKFGHPHNMYLMWAAEYGWIMILLMLALVLSVIRFFWLSRASLLSSGDSEGQALLVGFTASVSAALFHAGVSAVFMAPGSMLVGFFVLIGFWALVTPASPEFPKPVYPRALWRSKRLLGVFLAGVMSIFIFMWWWEVYSYYGTMRADQRYYYEELREGAKPRFWLHGSYPRG
ncbi:O-antigen ligase family protein [Marinobacter oulmenensis]|uniref:O-antigen ligase n=1 Tax=Marinobacter oulmenensis TaxID=643747 RepID=A0A840U9T0_9GAMM|nr:O-antigen ligase family protein [Marinobacter oulmenensis]MBB5322504.1 O-antigen ligase [Marinobacter oulmenensis]